MVVVVVAVVVVVVVSGGQWWPVVVRGGVAGGYLESGHRDSGLDQLTHRILCECQQKAPGLKVRTTSPSHTPTAMQPTLT